MEQSVMPGENLRCAMLIQRGDPLAKVNQLIVWEMFRSPIEPALKNEAKNPLDANQQLSEARTNAEAAKENAQKARDNLVNIHIGIGSEKSKSEIRSTTTVAEGSTVKARGDVTITSTKEDINIHGSSVEGENVTLNAAKDLNVTASENTNKTKEDHTASSGSIGVTVGLGGVMGVDAGYSRGKENIKENSTTYNESTVTAKKDLTFESGKDTNIRGGAFSGEKVTGKVGGDLNIESKKDSKDYESKSTSAGLGISYNPASGGVSVTGGVIKGSIESQYDSVTSQSGIYAGKEGFDISVEKNTDLKGAVIDSNAPEEKNQLTTGTLTWEDTKNKAEYEAGEVGVNVNTSSGAKLNEQGIIPSITPTVKGDADSTTKSAVAEGTITIKGKENQKQDIAELNRDAQNTLNKLHEIFNKDDVREKQELVGILAQEANKTIHTISKEKGWQEGSANKVLLHTIVGGVLGELSGNGFSSGAMAGGVNEYVIGYLERTKGKAWVSEHADIVQWTSITVGGAVNAAIGKDIFTGGSIAEFGTKWNFLKEELIDPNKGVMLIVTPHDILNGPVAGHISFCVFNLDGTCSLVEYDSDGSYNAWDDVNNKQKGVLRQVDFKNESDMQNYLGTKNREGVVINYSLGKESLQIKSIVNKVNSDMENSIENNYGHVDGQFGDVTEYSPNEGYYLRNYHLLANNCTIYVYSALRNILERLPVEQSIIPETLFEEVRRYKIQKGE